MKFAQHRITWRGEEWIAHARLTGRRVEVASLRRAGDRDPKTFLSGVAPRGEGETAQALDGLSEEERSEVVGLVFEEATRA